MNFTVPNQEQISTIMEYQDNTGYQVQGTQNQSTSTGWTITNLSESERTLKDSLFTKFRDMYIRWQRPVVYTLKQAQADIDITKDQYIKLMEILTDSGELEYVGQNSYGVREYKVPGYQGVELRHIPIYTRDKEDFTNQDWKWCQDYFAAKVLKMGRQMTFENLKEANAEVFEGCPIQNETRDEYVQFWFETQYKQVVKSNIYTPETAPSAFANPAVFNNRKYIPPTLWKSFLNYCANTTYQDTGILMSEYFGLQEYVDIIIYRTEGEPHCSETWHPKVYQMLKLANAFAPGVLHLTVEPGKSFEEFYDTNSQAIYTVELVCGEALTQEWLKWWYEEVYQKTYQVATAEVGIPF